MTFNQQRIPSEVHSETVRIANPDKPDLKEVNHEISFHHQQYHRFDTVGKT